MKNKKQTRNWVMLVSGLMLGVVVGITAGWILWGPRYGGHIMCLDGTRPDANGCCTGEEYTDLGAGGFACCPEYGDNCYPPMK